MSRGEIRHKLIQALLQAETPLALTELLARCELDAADAAGPVRQMVADGQVVEGELIAGRRGPHYRWAARWQEQARAKTAGRRKKLQEIINPADPLPEHLLTIDCRAVADFHDYIINDYTPPKDKRFLVFFQCSVRRPFSKSPSHGSMKRAIRVATGLDPQKDFETCPVHVVVLASRIGPVPYELEDVYPANVVGGGVKHFGEEHYAQVKPILARRMAEYITAHGGSYDRIATFTSGRYGDVMQAAREIAGADFPIFPDPDGRRVIQMAASKPRTYWAKFWIQLCLEIVSWLDRTGKRQAGRRLKERQVQYT